MHVSGYALTMAALSAAAAVAPAHSQSRGSVAGTITDAAGVPIAGAQVTLRDRGLMTISDSRGAFKLDGVPPGPLAVRVRRLGFRPETVTVSVAPSHPAMLPAVRRRDECASGHGQLQPRGSPLFRRSRPGRALVA